MLLPATLNLAQPTSSLTASTMPLIMLQFQSIYKEAKVTSGTISTGGTVCNHCYGCCVHFFCFHEFQLLGFGGGLNKKAVL